jgi:hypothetical protein
MSMPAGFEKVEGISGYLCGADITEINTNGKQVVILGTLWPTDTDHDCDRMGCSSMGEHVLVRLVQNEEGATT